MNTTEQEPALDNIGKIRLFTAIASLLLSFFAFYTDDIINGDGILYLRMAEAYLNGGLAATQTLFNWPFYSILISYTHQFSQLSLETSAAAINTIFLVGLTDTLILISAKLVTSRQQLIFASLLIISFYTLNEYRDFIIRDAGYWTFSTLALYRFMFLLEGGNLKNILYWLTPSLIAVLFRVEGIVLFLALPLYFILSRQTNERLKKSIRLGSVLIITIALIGFIAENQVALGNAFTKLQTVTSYVNLDYLLSIFNKKVVLIETQILNKYSEEYSGLILIAGLLAMLSYKLIKSISFGYITLYLISRWQQKENDSLFRYRSLLMYFIAINIAILMVFIFKQYFVVTRYTVVTSLGLLLLILPTICRSLEHAWLNKNYKLLSLAAIIMLISLIDTTTQSNSKSYIKNTATWAANNLPVSSSVLTDDRFLFHYYSISKPQALLCAGVILPTLNHKQSIPSYIKNPYYCTNKKSDYRDFDYLLIVEKRKHEELKQYLKEINITQIYHLENKRGDGASVYKINR